MSTSAPVVGLDLERTRPEWGGAAGVSGGGWRRGSILAGKYRLEMLLGEGGMACVWSAYHLELEVPVAIKLLRAGASGDQLAARLRFEARAVAHLAHPSIVRVLDIATTDGGEPFIVMELLTGETMAQLLARGRLAATRAVQLLLPIAEALASAHAGGVVHRDLKPDNVFIASEGQHLQPKLLDFGIAKLMFDSARKLTDKGMVLGSPHYMSPEQICGQDVDQASDIWSFCVLLYRAVTGTVPFAGSSERATLDAITIEAPLQAPLEDLDPQLARLVCWGLEKEPSRRPRSIEELGRYLAEWLLLQGISEDACGAPLVNRWLAHPPPLVDADRTQPSRRSIRAQEEQATRRIVPRPSRRWANLVAAALLLVGGGIVWHGWARSAPMPAAQALPEARPAALLPVVVAPEAPPSPSAAPPAPAPEPERVSSATGSATNKRSRGATQPRPTPASRLPF